MLAAKNNRSHLDITPCVQRCAVLRMLSDTDPRCSRGVTKATGVGAEYSLQSESTGQARGLALPLAPDFIMAG
jgi:hypothetical protein